MTVFGWRSAQTSQTTGSDGTQSNMMETMAAAAAMQEVNGRALGNVVGRRGGGGGVGAKWERNDCQGRTKL